MSEEELKVFKKLLNYAECNTCLHEEVYRGGSLWTICSNCGRKWADDRGGIPKSAHEYPEAILDAQAILDKYE